MIITSREFSRVLTIANKRFFRKFPELLPDQTDLENLSAYKVTEAYVNDRLRKDFSNPAIEEKSKQFTHWSILRQCVRRAIMVWHLEYYRLVSALRKAAS